MKKRSVLYVAILLFWSILIALFTPAVINEYRFADGHNVSLQILLTCNAIFIAYFWLNGAKDLIYVFWLYSNRMHLLKYTRRVRSERERERARVTLLYCTCNDFEPTSLSWSMHQNYSAALFKTVILDDSNDPKYKAEVDKFARTHKGVKVIRRKDRTGFKAGNINHYLKGRTDYDYFVILDSDERIPHSFIKRCLKYFAATPNAGIVQCNHIATRNENRFMQILHIGVNSHWPVYQLMKHHYGFMSLLGHGAMVSRKCYEQTGGFPEVVAEDLCFSIEARNHGYYVAFAPDITCEEQYPVDYLAFKKRHAKWTQGNFEFIKRYTWRIIISKMHWYEKLDIFLFTYNLPLTAFFSFYIFINVLILPLEHYALHYPMWLIIPTVIFFFAPMLNDFIFWIGNIKLRRLLHYSLLTFALYGSMLYRSIKASFLSLIGKKAVFIVTPKTSSHVTLLEAIRFNAEELAFAIGMAALALLFDASVLPTILIVVPAVLSVPLTMYSNHR